MNYLTENEARKEGDKIANELKDQLGGEWEVKTWENFGWCMSVDLGNIAVYKHYHNGKYSTAFSDDQHKHATPVYWSIQECFDTPVDAVLKQIEKAKDHVNKCVDVIVNQEILFTKLMEDATKEL